MEAPSILVCVVDDDPSVGRSLGRLLRSHGLRSRTFVSGSDLLANQCLSEVACVLIDLHMPEMGGLDLADRLAATAPGVPRILVTAEDEEAIRRRAKSTFGAAVLIKPFSQAELLAALEAALGRERIPTVL